MTLTIGRVASAVKVSTDTLRYYEREGLIAPTSKSRGGYRLYDGDAVRRVRFIKQAQHCGFTLTEIRGLLQRCTPRRTGGKATVRGEDQGNEGNVKSPRSSDCRL